MTVQLLKTETLKELGIENIHPLHSLMLDECCEKALENNLSSEKEYINATLIGFKVANDTLRGLLNGTLEKADSVTLNYGGSSFTIDSSSLLLK